MTPRIYYNEIDPQAAAWLRELMRADLIPAGDVDTRDIRDVAPDDLRGYVSCHFFAGIGGWAYALRLAGWPDDEPVWTGSCPCQPFSAAGKGLGTADERHLWPDWSWLIAQCRPAIVFGEQVASKAGRDWFAVVRADLEGLAYRVGAADLCAAGVGAPHIRQRLWFVAHADRTGSEAVRRHDERDGTGRARVQRVTRVDGAYGELAHADRARPQEGWRRPELRERAGERAPGACRASRDGLADADRRTNHAQLRAEQNHRASAGWSGETGRPDRYGAAGVEGEPSGLAHAGPQPAGRRLHGPHEGAGADGRGASSEPERSGRAGVLADAERDECGQVGAVARGRGEGSGEAGLDERSADRRPVDWRACDWLPCRDGKWRPVESGTFPLAHGIPARVGRLRGYGNAIVPPLAAAFIEAAIAALGDVEA